jgi:hypothetical protein
MPGKVIYWASTVLVAAQGVLAGVLYLSGTSEVVTGFAHVGYPQQLRVLLGIAKLLGAFVLIVPGFVTLKEWAYAGFTFAWIAAFVAHYLARDGPATTMSPVVLLCLLAVSYLTRPETRRWPLSPRRGVA